VANLKEKVRDEIRPTRGMSDLRMEEDAMDRTRRVLERDDGVARTCGSDGVPSGRFIDVIAMTHPDRHLFARGESVEEPRRVSHRDFGTSVFAAVRSDHPGTFEMRDELHPIADPQYGGDVEQGTIGGGDLVTVYGVRSPTQDNPGRLPLANPVETPSRWVNLRIHTRFADTTSDELRELRAKIENENTGVSHVDVIV
jgi:hypothetical protein